MTEHRPIDKLTPEARTALQQGIPLRNGTPVSPISVGGLNEEVSPFNLPQQSIPDDPQATIASIPTIETITADKAPTSTEKKQTGLQERLLSALGRLGGRSEALAQAEEEAQVPEFQKQLQDVSSQLIALQQEAKAIPIQTQEEALGRGITQAGLQPITSSRLRRNAIKALGLSAIAATLQGNLSLAQSQVDRAIDAEFGTIEAEITFLQTVLQINESRLSREDKQKADILKIQLDERQRLITDAKEKKREISSIAMTGLRFGAPTELVQKAFEAGSKEEAIGILGQFLQDPQAKLELETARLNNILKKEQIKKTQRETELLGEPTPAEKKKIEADIKNAETSIPIMQDKIDTIDALIDHSGMSVRVGTGIVSRGARGFIERGKAAIPGAIAGGTAGIPGGPLGVIGGGIVGGITTAFLAGRPITEARGVGQSFAGGVHQLTSGLSLQSLIDAKARGATFGALSDAELRLLSASATKLADWEIKDKNNVGTGYWNIDERSFKIELKTIQDLTRRALVESQGKLFTPEEQAIFDAVEETREATTNPADFF